MKLILEELISNVDFNSLGDDYRNLGLDKTNIEPYKFFSYNKNLFDYQEKALENAVLSLSSFFDGWEEHDYNYLKERQYKQFLEVLGEEQLKELDILSKNHKDRDILEILEEYFEVELDNRESRGKIVERIGFKNLINRMSFWMATGSGKSLVIIKLIYFVYKLSKLGKVPTRDFLFMAPKPSILEQIKEHIEEFNFSSDVKIRLVDLKDFEKEKTNSQVGIFEEIKLFYTKSDLIKDKESENQLDYRNYENNGNWYIFLDEAHKGDKESSKAQQYFNVMARKGFIFNFSATFTDIRDIATCVYNFNLAQFIRKGYGKNICLSNEEYISFNGKKDKEIEEYGNSEKQKIVLKSIINYVLVKKFYDDIKQIDDNFYHNPLMITIGSSVYTEGSDIELFFKEIKDIGLGKISDEVFIQAQNDLINDFKVDLKYIYRDETNINISLVVDTLKNIKKDDLYKYFYNAKSYGDIEYQTIVGNDKEVLLKLKTSDTPFAIIKIGSIKGIENEKLSGYEKTTIPASNNIFSNLNDKKSTINLLIGASAFYEGWDSNRPNIINFINIGLSDAKKFVMQSIGRGIRIKPILEERKRLSEIYKDLYSGRDGEYINKLKEILNEEKYLALKDKATILETLFLFSTKKDELKKVVEELDNDDISKNDFEIIDLFNKNKIKLDLYYPTYKSKSAKKQKDKKFRIKYDKLENLKNYVNDKGNILLLLDNGLNIKNISLLNKLLSDTDKYFEISDKEDNNKKIKYIILDIVNYFNYTGEEIDDFKVVDGKIDIISFKNISVSISNAKKLEELKQKISDKINEENISEDELDKMFDNSEITRDEYKEKLKNIGQQIDKEFTYENKTIKIKNIAKHYYNPVIISDDERIEWIKHIIDVESEVNFLNNLEKDGSFLDKQFDEWYFSKIDQHLDKAIRIPYLNSDSEKSNFIPDFIFWCKKGNDYYIYFIDPKGISFSSYQKKINYFNELFEDNLDNGIVSKIFSKNNFNIKVKLGIYNIKDEAPKEYKRYVKPSIVEIFKNID
ncbi:MAG: DEAD/DEAH box helicase family protein [Candidatus Gracilibacteria bacterium]|nr:DEAD/DEAH box helicase family protein [Candidatus Gracilibacteria bacterium]